MKLEEINISTVDCFETVGIKENDCKIIVKFKDGSEDIISNYTDIKEIATNLVYKKIEWIFETVDVQYGYWEHRLKIFDYNPNL